jgi:D-alanine-D-alanine ligase
VAALDDEKYEVVLIGIDKTGQWHVADRAVWLLHAEDPKLIKLNTDNTEQLALIPGDRRERFLRVQSNQPLAEVDVVFPVLHGPLGEDGTVQGLLKLANVPCVGAGVLGSAVGMDKDVMKRLLRDAGIPIPRFRSCTIAERHTLRFDEVVEALGTPVFVKPANLGSSVGVSRCDDETSFVKAVDLAFEYDSKIMIEQAIKGREIECSVLGNDRPVASVPGEVIPHHEFYSYDAKYIDPNGAGLEIPAKISSEEVARVQDLAVRTFKTLCCEGMGRVDFFLTDSGEVLVNEINTIPGFTRISMYPKLWEASGLSYAALIDRLIELALERHEREKVYRSKV